jgi:hypothetical protein
MSEMDISSVMASAMTQEDRRRELASQRPGHGALLPLEQPPGGPGVGIWDVDLPVTGLGYAGGILPSPFQVASYGPARPVYAADMVAGYDFAAGRAEPPVRRHVTDLGADGLFFEDYPGGRQPYGPVVVSPSAKPSLGARLRALLRRRLS